MRLLDLFLDCCEESWNVPLFHEKYFLIYEIEYLDQFKVFA